MINGLKGMNDIFGDVAKKYLYFIENATKIAKNYGFSYIETPILEETALFKRSVGESSDIVNKEMYQFIDKGSNNVCLRPEGTAGVVRSFIENKFDKAGGVYRFFYYGSMFRYERPQKGRFRSFHQFGCESFGHSLVYEDANIILLIRDILEFFSIKYKLKLNSLGCKECMPEFREELVKHLGDIEDGLCFDCQNRIKTNPIRVLDCKIESCKEKLKNSPTITTNLCENCDSDFEKLKSILSENGIDFEVDSNLVRGLDYYTKTAFEFVSSGLGAQNAIAGGGRYDRLIEFLDGRATPAIGFAIGIERILELIELPQNEPNSLFIGAMNEDGVRLAFNLASKIRIKREVNVDYSPKSLKTILKNGDKIGAKYCAFIGENELKEGKIWVKNLVSKEELSLDINSFLTTF